MSTPSSPYSEPLSYSWHLGIFPRLAPLLPNGNPIQNGWRTLKQRIRRRNPFRTTNITLCTAIEEQWAAITPDELEALVVTIPTCLREVRLLFFSYLSSTSS